MRRAAVLVLTVLLLGVTVPSGRSAPVAAAAAAPVHSVAVTGTGVATYPAFSPAVARYGITTTDATAGAVTVTASTSDPAGRVLVDGSPLVGGSRTVTGLTPGDEVAVFFEDSTGTARHSFIYLPAGFPTLERTTPDPAPGALEPGHVLLTLSQYVRPTPPALDYYEAAVDVNGVPAYARRTGLSMDLTRQPDGGYTVFRRSRSVVEGEDLVFLDAAFRPTGTRRAVGLVNTDGHDAIVQPDGTVWFMSYEPRNADGTGPVDAVVQREDRQGNVTFRWSSAPYQSEAVRPIDDYAHVNSFQVMADGDLLVSFRHLSSVYKIATTARPGVAVGDVVWKLGGRDSDFTFPAGDVGPCAQHTARELPDGDILMFDNGSADFTTAWCVDPADPTGPAVERVQTRVVAYRLHADGTVTRTFEYARGAGTPDRWFAVFAGSAQRLGNGDTLVGWAAERRALVSEIDPAGQLLWELRDPRPQDEFPYFSYRASKTVVPDVVPPEVAVSVPAAVGGVKYVEGAVVPTGIRCTDRGGSSLQSCDGPAVLDTSTPGERTATFTARDGAGGTTTVTRTFVVLPARRFTATLVSRRGTEGEQLTSRVGGRTRVTVRVTNTGFRPAALDVSVQSAGRAFRVRPRGVLTTPVLAPGQSYELRLGAVRRSTPQRRQVVTVRAGAVTLTWRLRAVRR